MKSASPLIVTRPTLPTSPCVLKNSQSARSPILRCNPFCKGGELKRRMAELTNALQAVGRYTDNSAADDADGAVDADFSDSHEEKH